MSSVEAVVVVKAKDGRKLLYEHNNLWTLDRINFIRAGDKEGLCGLGCLDCPFYKLPAGALCNSIEEVQDIEIIDIENIEALCREREASTKELIQSLKDYEQTIKNKDKTIQELYKYKTYFDLDIIVKRGIK